MKRSWSWRTATLVLVATLIGSNAALAYYSFVRSGHRTTWNASVFTTDYSASPVSSPSPAVPLVNGSINVGMTPNNDSLGLLIFADAQMRHCTWSNPGGSGNTCNSPVTWLCNDNGQFGRPGTVAYQAVFDALGTWSQVTSSQVNFAFACLNADLTVAAFDNVNDEPTSLDIFRSSSPHFNSINEIVFDDTTNADMIAALNVGLDPGVLLGLSFPFDSAHNLIVDPAANGTITEAFVIINQSGELLSSSIDLQGVLTHEFGHLLGLGHTASINVVQGTESNVPTMYFRALSAANSTQTRSLEPDDIAGITVNYPASGEPLLSFGSMSGAVLNTNGGNLKGAAIIAQDVGTGSSSGKEVSIYVGGNPDLDDTHYKISGVPAGSYRVELLAMNGASSSGSVDTSSNGNVDSIFTSPAFSFTTQYFDNVTDVNSASAVDVGTSSDTPNIDFTSNSSFNPNGLYGQLLQNPNGCSSAGGVAGLFDLLSLTIPAATVFLLKRHARFKNRRDH